MRGKLFSFVVFLCANKWFTESLQCTRENEMVRCGDCPPERTCATRGIAYNCFLGPHCRKSCVCKEGFIRNQFNECIPDKICDSCRGPNEFWDCGPACDTVCDTLEKQNRTNCPIVNITCNTKCYCKDGYARDAHGVCVPIDKCSGHKTSSSPPDCGSAGWWWFFRGMGSQVNSGEAKVIIQNCDNRLDPGSPID